MSEAAISDRSVGDFADQVQAMFDRIAGVYDLVNSAMTLGAHHRWREMAADRAALERGDLVLDACCGTGDLAFELARRVGPAGQVVGLDFSEPMLRLARKKAARRGAGRLVRFEHGDVLDLRCGPRAFDAVTVGFGVRNLADLEAGIGELARVLKPGGRLVILEVTNPRLARRSRVLGPWLDRLVPLLGSIVGDRHAYSYLGDSVRRFPSPEGLAEVIDRAGLVGIRYTLLLGGVITIHSATRPGAFRS